MAGNRELTDKGLTFGKKINILQMRVKQMNRIIHQTYTKSTFHSSSEFAYYCGGAAVSGYYQMPSMLTLMQSRPSREQVTGQIINIVVVGSSDYALGQVRAC